MAYSKLKSEGELETVPKDKTPSIEWPEKGRIELNKMKFKYALEYPYVLKSLSLIINPCEKVGHNAFSIMTGFAKRGLIHTSNFQLQGGITWLEVYLKL